MPTRRQDPSGDGAPVQQDATGRKQFNFNCPAKLKAQFDRLYPELPKGKRQAAAVAAIAALLGANPKHRERAIERILGVAGTSEINAAEIYAFLTGKKV